VVLDAVTSSADAKPPDRIRTADGVDLEYILGARGDARPGIVLCHPHPRHGGTMRAPILGAIASRAIRAGFDVLRFNFRGVGGSTGSYGDGIAEIEDVDAAVGWMARRDAPVVGIAGWSFGAATALRWEARSRTDLSYVGIAPPVTSPLTQDLPEPGELAPARRTFIVGNCDQFVDADALARYAETIGAGIIRYETADHFFVFRHERLADDVVASLMP